MEELVSLMIRVWASAERLDQSHSAIRDEQIEKTIVIVVEPLRSEACAGKTTSGQTCLDGRIVENAFTIVDIKSIGLPGEVRDENILVAIVVKIARGYTHSSLRSSVGVVRDTR